MLKPLISKLVGISSAVAITGSLAAGPANATVYGPVGSPYLNTCRVTGPRISTITEASPRPGSGDRLLAIRGTCFPAGRFVYVYFRSNVPGDPWNFNSTNLHAASDGTFTIPMVWRPRTTIIQTTANESVTAYYGTEDSSYVTVYPSNTLVFQVGGTIILH